MELELGFKISKTLDEYSSADLRISKDQTGPVFVSRETETMFVLNAHLKGYKKEQIQIKVNEDGTRITISGERPVQEMVMVKWQMHKKDPEIRGFKKTFKIPEGVKLDKIKARFNEDESVLTISMPKLVKGFQGLKIGEITEEEIKHKESDNLAKENDDKIVSEISPSKGIENQEQVVEEANNIVSEEIPPKESEMQGLEYNNSKENSVLHQEQGQNEGDDEESEKGKNVVEQQENENGEQVVEESNNTVHEKIPPMENEIQGVESDNLKDKSSVHRGQEMQDEVEGGEQTPPMENEIQGVESDNLKDKSSIHQGQEMQDEVEGGEQIPPMENEIQGVESDNLKGKSSIHREQEVQDEGEDGEQILPMENKIQGVESDNLKEKSSVHREQEVQDEGEDGERKNGKNVIEQQENEERQNNDNLPKLCVPMIAGTAFIVSLIVFVMHMIKAKNAPNNSKKS